MAQRDVDALTTMRAGVELQAQPGAQESPTAGAGAASPAPQPAQAPVIYSMSPGLSAFLGSQRIALAISSYQSGKFYLLGQNVNGGLLVDERFFRKAMGICVPGKDTLLLATLMQIFKFRNVLEPGQQINNVFDACYVRPLVPHRWAGGGALRRRRRPRRGAAHVAQLRQRRNSRPDHARSV
jgi:hypothetical protein